MNIDTITRSSRLGTRYRSDVRQACCDIPSKIQNPLKFYMDRTTNKVCLSLHFEKFKLSNLVSSNFVAHQYSLWNMTS